MEAWRENLRNPPKEYRPVPFWSWNERLREEETRRQIEEMDKAGLGGYFMHARGGLQTPYMGEEWMANIRAGIDEGARRGMGAWGYDENGWPSGFGSGAVNGLGEKYQQKYLRFAFADEPQDTPRTVANVPCGGRLLHLYYEVNPFYVDLMDPAVTRAFLKSTHAAYRDTLGGDFRNMAGFFTDEPQLSRNGMPWSLLLPDAYREAYGEDLLPLLPALFFPEGNWERTRVRFWQVVRDLFAENFIKQVQDWCRENGVRLTGHMVLEETMRSQLVSNGAVMPMYEYMDIPGMDWLGRMGVCPLTVLQLSSAAHQLGKKQILSESFALCGWNVSFEDLKWMFDGQMVRGVTLLCPHLEAYSLRGIRKRDYPAALFYQQPWWSEYRAFVDMVSRIGMLLSEGEAAFETLVLHPQSSAWIAYDDQACAGLDDLDAAFARLIDSLEDRQILFHLGDERLLQRHGRVEGDRLCVGVQRYRAVVVPSSTTINGFVLELLRQFQANGGTILWSDRIPAMVDGEPSGEPAALAKSGIVRPLGGLAAAVPDTVRRVRLRETGGDARQIVATERRFADGRVMVYLVNELDTPRRVEVILEGRQVARLDVLTGEVEPVLSDEAPEGRIVSLELEPLGSAVLFGLPEAAPETAQKPARLDPLNRRLSTSWTVAAADKNARTLDTCAAWLDGKPVGDAVPVNNLQEMACALERPVEVAMVFPFEVETVPAGGVELVMETPEKYRITLNGEPVEQKPQGWYFDTSFIRLPLPALKSGHNELKLETTFRQSPDVYENIQKSLVFESEKNKLTYDDEIEAVYLVGDFGVSSDAPFVPLDRQALRCGGSFRLGARPGTVEEGALAGQGFPFFAGRIRLSQRVALAADELAGRSLRLERLGATVTAVFVNGRPAGKILWRPYEVSLDGLLREGDNVIEVELTGTLRNLLGPHHLKEGECYSVVPGSFFETSPLWAGGKNPQWDPAYCFVEFGLFLER